MTSAFSRLRFLRPALIAFAALAIGMAGSNLAIAQTTKTFTNSTSVSLQGDDNQTNTILTQNSAVMVSGIDGTVTNVKVTLTGLSSNNVASGLGDFSFLLVPPENGAAFDFLNASCYAPQSVPITITLADGNSQFRITAVRRPLMKPRISSWETK